MMIGPSWPMMHPSADLDPVAGASSHKYDGAEVLGQKKVYVPAATHLLRSEALLRAAHFKLHSIVTKFRQQAEQARKNRLKA